MDEVGTTSKEIVALTQVSQQTIQRLLKQLKENGMNTTYTNLERPKKLDCYDV